jgi:hypothetical protein
VLTRCTAAACGVEFDTAATMLQGSFTRITAGSVNIGRSYALTATVATVGATSAVFVLTASSSADGILYTAPGTGGVSQAQSRHNQNILWAHDYGAVCDGATDDTTAFQNLLAKAQSLKVPARFNGACVSDTLTITSAVDFGGVNQWTSVLSPLDNTHDLIKWATTEAVLLSNFRIDYFTGTGTAITCDGTGTTTNTANEKSRVDHVRTDTPGISLKMLNCAYFILSNSFFNEGVTNNVLINNTANCDFGDNKFYGNSFIKSLHSGDNFRVLCGGGQHVFGNKFNGGPSTASVSYSLGSGLTNSHETAHIFTGNSIEGSDICFNFSRAAGTGLIGNVNISGNEMGCAIGVQVAVSGGSAWVQVMNLSSNTWTGPQLSASNVFANIDGVNGLLIGSNALSAGTVGTIAVFLGSQSGVSTTTVGPLSRSVQGLGTWSGSTIGSALAVQCNVGCY